MIRLGRSPLLPALVLLLLATPLPLAASQVPAPPPPLGRGDIYLALGDSIAAGVGASRPGERGYAALLADYLDHLGDRPIERHNLAVPGETTAGLLAGGQLDEALSILAAARRDGLRVSPVTLTIGANDLLRAAPDPASRAAALTDLAGNLRAILERLRLAGADEAGRATADLVVTGYYDPTGGLATRVGSDAWWLAQMEATIAGEARRAGVPWVDTATRFRDRTAEYTWYPSDIHPTNAGYRAIADAVWHALGYDAEAPTVRIERPVAGPLDRPRPTIVVTAGDNVGVAGVELSIDGAIVGEPRFLPEIDAYALVWDTNGAPPGPHELAATARDGAGNATTARVVVEIVLLPGAG
jgi:lysophospholipase L1-like esterase